ncbi:hypothetical protein P7K49_010248 [Saguinus oedipus]|uniref:Uncharacterized protein n=1 Tax=Saguinus oedipus TaxID=9490 RepID=A0ABQ9VMR3_SAGOE|nr:hypothetical protein P7K49_010248 [Saguinus oedipus]
MPDLVFPCLLISLIREEIEPASEEVPVIGHLRPSQSREPKEILPLEERRKQLCQAVHGESCQVLGQGRLPVGSSGCHADDSVYGQHPLARCRLVIVAAAANPWYFPCPRELRDYVTPHPPLGALSMADTIFSSGNDQWVCPNDRQLALRAK